MVDVDLNYGYDARYCKKVIEKLFKKIDNFNYNDESYKKEIIVRSILELKQEIIKGYLKYFQKDEELEELREHNRSMSRGVNYRGFDDE